MRHGWSSFLVLVINIKTCHTVTFVTGLSCCANYQVGINNVVIIGIAVKSLRNWLSVNFCGQFMATEGHQRNVV
jgi:hypothetical protein